jgi:NADP-dependent 3-hydroxy acid dehydrogenase YdfG
MLNKLTGRVALVTGASSGIGEGAALALAAAGVKVALSARRGDRLTALVSKIAAAGGEAIALIGDVTDEAAARDAVEQTVKRLGRIDILINSAGGMQPGSVENADVEQWRKLMELNFFGTLHTCKAAIKFMRAQGSGDIINISSTAGRRAIGMLNPYCSSKFALTAMTEGMRQEIGAHGIRVCIIEPGATKTDISEGVVDPQFRDQLRDHVSKDGAMTVEDIAESILFVVSLPARVNVSQILIRPTIDIVPI